MCPPTSFTEHQGICFIIERKKGSGLSCQSGPIREERSGCMRSFQNVRKSSRVSTGNRTNCGIEER